MLRQWWRGKDRISPKLQRLADAPSEDLNISDFLSRACGYDHSAWPPQKHVRLFLSATTPDVLDVPETMKDMASFLFFKGNRLDVIVNGADKDIPQSRLLEMMMGSPNAKLFSVSYSEVQYSFGLVADDYFYAQEGAAGIYVKNAPNTPREAALKKLQNVWQAYIFRTGEAHMPKPRLIS